ncbi:hypothetical protein Kpol_2002p54 [Vanderwaltozyma polyspora DSM 70294]|uniref:Beige protein homolog 1 n=1 Tax=Vanderwaltozyma polyspora (strain ATCC 22028 / DSM 70294 / BCRC 21397 / CBS 2163 / NBRC 10782 / NRRL Y-8283 / UCD 57-17) TaxID=436907 RepID=A7TFG9_VANPO|nr:uncharacterized protein Kpol_2002p54 [Vanderwaltozyma polyspora DSM 70294]EDO18983.1 hypothetical protein Kpol_2002p54 [Vanderwaltozyma polyspora DSM 70294]
MVTDSMEIGGFLSSIINIDQIGQDDEEDHQQKELNIIWNDLIENFETKIVKTSELIKDIESYVDWELTTTFSLSNIDDNFIINDSNIQQWLEFIVKGDEKFNSLQYSIALQIIISLSNISLFNKQKFASWAKSLKESLLDTLLENDKDLTILTLWKKILLVIYSIDCTPTDLLNLYKNFEENHFIPEILNELAKQSHDQLSQSYLQFENYYKSYKLKSLKTKIENDLTFQIYLELNDITSNRIMTIGRSLFLEVTDGQLCLSNDEYIIGMFQNFEFKPLVFYCITLTVNSNDIALFVNGQYVNTVSLFENFILSLSVIELGSMICSFRLYRFQLLNAVLSELEVKVLYHVGSNYKITKENTGHEILGIRRAFGDSFLQQIFQSITAREIISLTEGISKIRNLKSDALLIDFNPYIELNSVDHNNFLFLENKEHDSIENSTILIKGNVYYYKSSTLSDIFETFNSFRFVLSKLEVCDDYNKLYEYVFHMVQLWSNYQLRVWFESKFGYQLLSHILTNKVIYKHKKALPIQFLNLFLEYSGWELSDITKSIIKDQRSYENLVLNINLWYLDVEDNEQLPSEIEIIRFLFFQISNLLETSKYKRFNSRVLMRSNIIQKFCNYQHYLTVNMISNDIVSELNYDLVNVYVTLLKNDFTKQNVQWLFNYSYYELKCGNYSNCNVLLTAIDTLILETLDNNRMDTLQVFNESLSIKFLLMAIDEIVTVKKSPLILLNILLKIFSINTNGYQKFLDNSGMNLLLDILKGANVADYEEIVYMLYKYSLGEFDYTTGSIQCENFDKIELLNENIVINKYLLNLSVCLLEWSVINDIRSGFQIDLNTFIISFMNKLSVMSSNKKNSSVFDTRKNKLLTCLLDLLVTLTKHQNGSIYLESALIIKQFLADNIIYQAKYLNTNEFGKYINSITESDDSSNSFIIFSEDQYIYIQFLFVKEILPVITSDLSGLKTELAFKFRSYPYMVSNLLSIYNYSMDKFATVELPLSFYLSTFSVLMESIKAIEISDHDIIKNVSKANLLNIFNLITLRLVHLLFVENFRFDEKSTQDLLNAIVKNAHILFKSNNSVFDKDMTWILMLFLISESSCSTSGEAMLACLRNILIYNKSNQKYISEVMNIQGKIELSSLIESLETSNSNETLALIEKSKRHIVNLDQRDKLINYITKRLENGMSIGKFNSFDEISIEELKQLRMDRDDSKIEKIHGLFRNDNYEISNKVYKLGNKQFSNFITDIEEENLIFDNEYEYLTFQNNQILSLQLNQNISLEWTVQPVEDFERSRRKLLPSQLRKCIGESSIKDDSSVPDEQLNNSKKGIGASSMLSYDLMSDLDLSGLSDADNSDENRKVLKLLKENDLIKKIWNCSRIVGLDIKEGVLILGENYLYFVDNYYFSKDGKKVVNLSDVPLHLRDTNMTLIGGDISKSRFSNVEHKVFNWDLTQITHVTKRPFLLRDIAMEVLFSRGSNFLFSFNTKSIRENVYLQLSKVSNNSNIDPLLDCTLVELNSRSHGISLMNGISKASLKTKFLNALSSSSNFDEYEATKLWQNGEISNFCYLMILNTLAGRTFNDLTQYPVFPWIIADQESEFLDLANPKTFRDLSKPMGGQTTKRAEQFKERYESLCQFDEQPTPPFHYGTHYSSAMIVSSYLIRLKPFVDSFLLLQDGRFGHADRLFSSIPRAWKSSAVESTTDVRELIPEFFFLPEFLINTNHYDFGKDQNGNTVSNVKLPLWANGDPLIYIAKNREALETEYVSEHLHEWIDLIFGYKQKGEKSVDSLNVFNNLSYPGAVDLENINDENERRAITAIIHNFGQTPLQLFSEPHPRRNVLKYQSIKNCIKNICDDPYCIELEQLSKKSIDLIFFTDNTTYKADSSNDAVNLKCNLVINSRQFFEIEFEKFGIEVRKLKRLIKFDNTIVISVEFGEANIMVTGDKNGMIKIWKIKSKELNNSSTFEYDSLGSMHGHLFGIKEMKIYNEYQVLVSLDYSGVVYLWDLSNFQIIRKLADHVSQIAVSQVDGNIITVNEDNNVAIYNLNGMLYCERLFKGSKITSIAFFDFSSISLGNLRHAYWKEKEAFAIGYNDGSIDMFILELSSLSQWDVLLVKSLKSKNQDPITSLKFQLNDLKLKREVGNEINIQLFAGDNRGKLYKWGSK